LHGTMRRFTADELLPMAFGPAAMAERSDEET
jgi:hypothetical protein